MLNSKVVTNSKEFGQFKIPALDLATINTLMKFAIEYSLMDEYLWSQILKLFEFSLSNSVSKFFIYTEFLN